MRYIEADKTLAFISRLLGGLPLALLNEYKKNGIDIVRCKECKYWIENLTDDDADETYGECCFDWDIKMPKADDFCSYGEREGE